MTMTPYEHAYDEYLEFLTSAPTLQQIVYFEPSAATESRLQYLIETRNAGVLTEDEKKELDESAKAVYFMDMLKIRARRKLGMSEDI